MDGSVKDIEKRYMQRIIVDLHGEKGLFSLNSGLGCETVQDLARQYYIPNAKKTLPNFLPFEASRDFLDSYILEELAQQEPEYYEDDTFVPEPMTVLFERNPRMVLVGNPGAGKTISMLYLTLLLAANYQHRTGIEILDFNLSDFEDNVLSFEESYVPIFISLKEQHFTEKERRCLKISSLIARELSKHLKDQESERLAAQLLAENRTWLIFDGLDEMIPSDRWIFLHVLASFLNKKDNLPITLSSRKIGIPFRDLLRTDPDILPIFELVPEVTKSAIQKSAINWLGQEGHPQANQQVDKLLDAENLSLEIRQALVNPMLLRMLLHLYLEGHFTLAKLPQTRFQIYEAYIRTIAFRGTDTHKKMHVLEDVGWFRQGSSTPLDKNVLAEKLTPYFPAVAERDAWFEEFSSLLYVYPSSMGEGGYMAFRHQSLQEFFVARRILAIWNKGRKGRRWVWKKIISPNLGSSHYHEILLFVFMELSRKPADFKRLIRKKTFQKIWQVSSIEFKREMFFRGILDPVLALRQKDVALWLEAMEVQGVQTDVEMIKALLLLSNDEDILVRERAEEALDLYCVRSTIDLLLPLLQDERYQIRAGATKYLGKIGDPVVIPEIIPLLDDKEEIVRRMAARALGHIGDASVIPFLQPLVEDEDFFVPEAAIEALGEIGGQEAVKVILPLLGHEESRIRLYASWALADIGGTETLQSILSLLEGENCPHFGVIEALGEFDDPDAAEALEGLLENETRGVRLFAAETLVKIRGGDAIPAIQKLLEDNAYEAREFTAELLGEIGGAAAQQLLEKLLLDTDARVERRAIYGLGKIRNPSSVSAIVAKLRHPYSYIRREAADALGKIGDPRAVKPLQALLAEKDERSVLKAIKSLGEIGGDDAVAALLPILEHPDSSIRVRAVEALGKIGSTKAIQILGGLAEDTGYYVWETASYLLGEIGNEQAVQALLPAFKNSTYYIHSRAEEALEKIGGEVVVQSLYTLLQDGDAEVRCRAVELLGKFSNLTERLNIVPLLGDINGKVRKTSASALGKLPDPSVIPALLPLLSDEDFNVRENAAYALGRIGDNSTIPDILKLLEDDDLWVQSSAVHALGNFKDPLVVPALLPLLEDENAALREDAVSALGKIGDPVAVPALLPLLMDANMHVREKAADTLAKIETTPPLPEPPVLSPYNRITLLRFLVLASIIFVVTGISLATVLAVPEIICQRWSGLCANIHQHMRAVFAILGLSGAASVFTAYKLFKDRPGG